MQRPRSAFVSGASFSFRIQSSRFGRYPLAKHWRGLNVCPFTSGVVQEEKRFS